MGSSNIIPVPYGKSFESIHDSFRKLNRVLGLDSSPTFAGLSLTGDLGITGGLTVSGTVTLNDLSASRLVATNGSDELVSSDLIGWVAGTANQISVADDADGSITLSTPQDIHTGATPTFAGLICPSVVGGALTTEDLTLQDNAVDGNTVTVTQMIAAYSHSQLVAGNPHSVTPTELGLVTGTNVQAWDAQLDDIAALAVTDGNIIVGNGANWVAESGTTARTSLGLGTGDSPQFTGIELGHADDTTITRVSAGVIAVEGVTVMMVGGSPTAHVHDGDTLEHNGVNSDGGAFAFNTTGAVTFSEAITMSAGKDLTIAGHILFNTNNSYIGFTNPRITFNDVDNTLDITGDIVMADDASIKSAAGDPSMSFDDCGHIEVTSGDFIVSAGYIASGVSDTTRGFLHLYGGATGYGGSLYFYTPADSDTTINTYNIFAHDDDFTIGTDVDQDIIMITAGSAVSITTTLGVTGLISGDDVTLTGRLNLPTTTSTEGQIRINSVAAFHTFEGAGSVGYNLFVGPLAGNFTLGIAGGASYLASKNMGMGGYALPSLTTGYQNLGIGYGAGYAITVGWNNMCLGAAALGALIGGTDNVGIGTIAGLYHANGTTVLATANYSIYIGGGARGFNNSDNNTIVIGYGAIGTGANKIRLGNTSITQTQMSGSLSLGEITAAPADTAGYGQIWCKDNAGTTELWFTDDGGTDTKIV